TEVIALYSFTGESEDELTMWAGDTIQLLEIVNDDWLKGSLNGNTGIFPSSYVELTPAIKSELMSKKHDTLVTTALYEYQTNVPGDLAFAQGDHITIVARISDEWLEGMVDDRRGILPAAYV
ncbi:predicted protein, partial [Nematostella vectensis]